MSFLVNLLNIILIFSVVSEGKSLYSNIYKRSNVLSKS